MDVKDLVVLDVEVLGRVPDIGGDDVVDAVPLAQDGVELLADLAVGS